MAEIIILDRGKVKHISCKKKITTKFMCSKLKSERFHDCFIMQVQYEVCLNTAEKKERKKEKKKEKKRKKKKKKKKKKEKK